MRRRPFAKGIGFRGDLPKYGRVQHTYEEMLAAHDELIPSLKDRVTVLHLGGTFQEETHRLYLELAAGPLPRGSKLRLEGDVLRFFVHWRQKSKRTDYDLSAVLLDENFGFAGIVSWTRLQGDGAFYSGDITDAANGATEFIDLQLDAMDAKYVVPQVNIYSGEGFDEVAESMFGFMTRDRERLGKPFEPSTVRARSAMRGKGKVALPVMFERAGDGWRGTWLHLYLRGRPWGNRIEENRDLVKLIVAAARSRQYFTVARLQELFVRKGSTSDCAAIRIGLAQSESGGVTAVTELGNMLSD